MSAADRNPPLSPTVTKALIAARSIIVAAFAYHRSQQ
jgi:hypothetical protein